MLMLADQPLKDVLAAFASAAPTPAGGSASALASALGVSLLMMAATLPRTRSGSGEDRRLLNAASVSLPGLQHQLTDAIDQDAKAYGQVASAHGAALQDAIKGAIDVPLEVMRLSAEALRTAPIVAARCHRAASSDVGVGIDLLRAGFAGARSTAEANLRRVSDEQYLKAVRAEISRLSNEAGVPVEAPRPDVDS
jgi:formiminotetrahydrofolate cyclodeaminase